MADGCVSGFRTRDRASHHLEVYLLWPFLSAAGRVETRPHVALIVSGGHTMLVLVRGLADYQLIGRTVDDAAGEAFDKVAKMLGLRYPGGPEIEKQARSGNPKQFDLPRSMLGSENFSFSGLKTAVRYLLSKIGVVPSEVEEFRGLTETIVHRGPSTPLRFTRDDVLNDVCASFQQAVIDVLVTKTIAAAQKYHLDLVTMSGGVSCNQELRRQMREACARKGIEFKSAEPSLCTDNAAMIAFTALLRLQDGRESQVTDEIDPNLALVR